MDIKEIPISEIRPYWRNPRHNADAVEAVKQSIEDYGYNQPIVVDSALTIIAGHTRYKALQQLGYEMANVIVTDLPPAKAKEYRIIDNKSGELSQWNWDNLVPELREIQHPDKLEVYFPELDLESVIRNETFSLPASPTQEKIDDRQHLLEGAMVKKNAADLDGYVPLICPECGEEFAVDKEDFLKRVEERDDG